MWYNKYVGIPYKNNGRDVSGIDCWGLVRLIYKEQYNISIPSFTELYKGPEDKESISELAAIAKEQWKAVETPQEGDVVLFRVLGLESHVGVCIGSDSFIHAKEGQASVIESLTSSRWKDRIVGYFKYTSDPTVIGIPHPFKTDRYTDTIAPGTTVVELVNSLNTKYSISDKLKFNLAVMINGVPVDKEAWSTTVIKENDKIEYRAIPRGDDPMRMVLMIAVMIAAPQIAGLPTLGLTVGTPTYMATVMAIQMVGMALVDVIAPVRMPEKNDPGAPESINMLSGGSNSANMYGTIPVILGRIRVTPPLGAQTILESPEDSSFLRMITVWGFGPLFLDDTTLQIGGTSIQEFKDRNGALPSFYHLDFNSQTSTQAEKTQFDGIYGYDTTQQVPNVQLILENNVISSNEAILYKANRIATTGISYTGNAVDSGLRLIVDESTGSFYLRDEGWNTSQATFGISATQGGNTSSTQFTVRKNQAGTGNFNGTAPFAVVKSSLDIVSMDGNSIFLPTGNKVTVYGYGKEMSASANAAIYNVQFSLLSSTGNGLAATINSTTGEITLTGAENWTGTEAEFTFRATYTGGYVDAVYRVIKPTASELSTTNGFVLLKYETQVFTADINGAVSDLSDVAGPWSTVTLETESTYTSLEATLHFPEGLRKIQVGGTYGVGRTSPASFIGEFQYRGRFPPSTQWEAWTTNTFKTSGWVFSGGDFLPGVTSYDAPDAYKWIRVYLANRRGVGHVEGRVYESPNTATVNATYATVLSGGSWSTVPVESLKPAIPTDSLLLYEICLRCNSTTRAITQESLTSNLANIGTYTGLGISSYFIQPSEYGPGSYRYTVDEGYLLPTNSVATTTDGFNVAGSNLVAITDNKKDAFNRTIFLDRLKPGQYQIRFRRLNSSNADIDPVYRQYYKTIFYSVTGRTSNPVIIPPTINGTPVKLARTAFRFESSAKINGQIDGINGIVQTIARVYKNGNWNTFEPTNNPASLFLYVLTHPANAYRITSAEESTRIKLTGTGSLGEWYDYCDNPDGDVNTDDIKFQYNNVMDGSRSVLEVLRDIAAAGRASPIIIDGKWTVVVDKPRAAPVQHFSPHNSWGFESTKAIPKLPHAFRIVYRDEDNGYQETEQIVYNQTYNETNAEVFEELSLPGITKKDLVIKHARWNLAQAKLRPERYTLNTDLEYLVCNRGDLVRVVHDVPMWGSGSGRIKNYINSTTLELDEPVYMTSGTNYGIRIRTEAGLSVTRTVAASGTSGYKTQITLTAAVTATEGAGGNLFLFGTLNSESQELIVLNIEPLDNRNARLTLVDYSPQIYSIDQSVIYPIPAFNPSITAYASIDIQPITALPVIGTIRSDIGSMNLDNDTTSIDINVLNAVNLPELIDRVELYYYSSNTNRSPGSIIRNISAGTGGFNVPDVQKDDIYVFKARYLDRDGRIGPWTAETTHTVVGKIVALDTVTSMTITRVHKNLVITPVIVNRSTDFSNYEFRVVKGNLTTDFWNTATNYVKVTSVDVGFVDLMQFSSPRITVDGITYSVACRAMDYLGNYSGASKLGQITIKSLAP